MTQGSSLLRFGPYELDAGRLELRRRGRRVRMQSKPLAVLVHLALNANRTVTHEELLREVWSGIRVDASALKSAVHAVRRALSPARSRAAGDTPESQHRWIRTVYGSGYRFVGEVRLEIEPQPSPEPRTKLRDFVDREVEMERLRAACRAALSGERQVVLLEGPPGIGKTRSAAECARDAEALGFEVHVARAHEGDGAPPLWPWIQILQSWVSAHEAGALEVIAARSGTDRIARILNPPPEAPGRYSAEESERFHLLNQMMRFLQAAAARRPLMIVLDDLHRADSSSLELLLFITQHLPRAALLVVGTHRPVLPGHLLGRVLREPGTSSVVLSGLSIDSVRRILEEALQREPPPELVAQLHRATGGNPLFVSELVRVWAGSGAAADIKPPPVPDRVHDAISARISECSEPCQQLLKTASLLGPEVKLPLLRDVLGMENRVLLTVLEEAQQRDLVVATGPGYAFVHGVVRESLYEKMSLTERIERHHAIARALDAQSAGGLRNVAELAYHFTESAALAQADRAVFFAQRAAEAARAAFAYQESADLYRKALAGLELLERPDPELRVSLLTELGDLLVHAGLPVAVFQAVFMEAIELGRAASLPRLVALAASGCALHLVGRGAIHAVLPIPPEVRSDLLRSVLEQLREAPEITSDVRLHARLLLSLALLCFRKQRDAALRLIEAALSIAAPGTETRVEVLQGAYQLGLCFERPEWRLEADRELRRWSRESQDLRWKALAVNSEVGVALESGRPEALERAAARIQRMSDEIAMPILQYMSALVRAVRAQLEGPADLARRLVVEASEVGSRANVAPTWTGSARWICDIWLALLAEAAPDTLERADEYLESAFDCSRILPALVCEEYGRRDQAERELAAFLRPWTELPKDTIWLVYGSFGADLSARLGEPALADLIWNALRPYADRVLVIGETVCCMGSVARTLGSLACLLGRWSEAEHLFASAFDHAERLRAPVLKALVQVDRCLAFRRHPERAERKQSERDEESVREDSRRLGLSRLVRRLDA